MSEQQPTSRAYEAGYASAQRAIADRAHSRKRKELRWTTEEFNQFWQEWQDYLSGWMQAIREDKQRQLSWEEFYFPE